MKMETLPKRNCFQAKKKCYRDHPRITVNRRDLMILVPTEKMILQHLFLVKNRTGIRKGKIVDLETDCDVLLIRAEGQPSHRTVVHGQTDRNPGTERFSWEDICDTFADASWALQATLGL